MRPFRNLASIFIILLHLLALFLHFDALCGLSAAGLSIVNNETGSCRVRSGLGTFPLGRLRSHILQQMDMIPSLFGVFARILRSIWYIEYHHLQGTSRKLVSVVHLSFYMCSGVYSCMLECTCGTQKLCGAEGAVTPSLTNCGMWFGRPTALPRRHLFMPIRGSCE